MDRNRLVDLYVYSYREGNHGLRSMWPWRFLLIVFALLAVVVISVVLNAWWLATIGGPLVVAVLSLTLMPHNIREEQRRRGQAFREETQRRQEQ